MTSVSDPLRHALAYARLGWHVFPLAPRSKKPAGSLVPRGHLDATRDETLIRDWWSQADLGVGVALAPSGLVLADIDPRHAGDETLVGLERDHGELPPTVEAVTGGGGAHFLFKRPSGLEPHDFIGLWPGVDVKALGYAAVAPTVHPDTGQAYRWAIGSEPGRVELAPLPAWIEAAMAAQRNGHHAAASVPDRIPEGSRNATLTSLAGSMRRRGMSLDAIEAALLVENARCDPLPLPDAEVRAIAASVSRYAPASTLPARNGTGQDDAKAPPPRTLIVHSAIDERVALAEKPVESLVEGLWVAGAITELSAKIKAGKTSFTLALLRALLAGEPFLKLATVPSNILYLTEERPATFREALNRHDVGEGLSVVYRHQCFGLPWPEVAALALAYCQQNAVDGLIVDTLSTWAGVKDENDAAEAMNAVRPLEEAAAAGLAVLYVRHDRKSGGELGESGRGSSAFAGAADILLQLKRADTEGHANRRVLSGVGRFDNVPAQLVIELTETAYVNLGDAVDVEQQRVRDWLLDHLPAADRPATEADLLAAIGPTASRSTLKRVLDRLVEAGAADKAAKGFGPTKRAAGYWRVSK